MTFNEELVTNDIQIIDQTFYMNKREIENIVVQNVITLGLLLLTNGSI